jgi:hypothetical protein
MLQADKNHKDYWEDMQWIQADIAEIDWIPECDVIFNLSSRK